jgi:hypothetical protein
MKSPENVFLTSDKTVADYRALQAADDRVRAGELVVQRFQERYLWPAQGEGKHGFAMMAIACLLIETYQGFVLGRANTKMGDGAATFRSFFEDNAPLKVFAAGKENWFYKNVRCGILHQAEVRDGWRIRRDDALLDFDKRTINATKFLRELEGIIAAYPQRLADDDALWTNFCKKMDAVCRTCEAGPDVGPQKA